MQQCRQGLGQTARPVSATVGSHFQPWPVQARGGSGHGTHRDWLCGEGFLAAAVTLCREEQPTYCPRPEGSEKTTFYKSFSSILGNPTGNHKAQEPVHVTQGGQLLKGMQQGEEGGGLDVDEQTEPVQNPEKASMWRENSISKRGGGVE